MKANYNRVLFQEQLIFVVVNINKSKNESKLQLAMAHKYLGGGCCKYQ